MAQRSDEDRGRDDRERTQSTARVSTVRAARVNGASLITRELRVVIARAFLTFPFCTLCMLNPTVAIMFSLNTPVYTQQRRTAQRQSQALTHAIAGAPAVVPLIARVLTLMTCTKLDFPAFPSPSTAISIS